MRGRVRQSDGRLGEKATRRGRGSGVRREEGGRERNEKKGKVRMVRKN